MATQTITLIVKSQNAEKAEKDLDKIAKATKDWEKKLEEAAKNSVMMGAGIQLGFKLIGDAVRMAVNAITSLAEQALKPLKTTFDALADSISKNYLEVVGRALLDNQKFQNMVVLFGDAVKANAPATSDFAATIDKTITIALKIIEVFIRIGKVVTGVVDAVMPVYAGFTSVIGTLFDELINRVIATFKTMVAVGREIAVALHAPESVIAVYDGILGKQTGILDNAKNVVKGIVNIPDTIADKYKELNSESSKASKFFTDLEKDYEKFVNDVNTKKLNYKPELSKEQKKELADIAKRNKAVLDMSNDLLEDMRKDEEKNNRKRASDQAESLNRSIADYTDYWARMADIAEKQGKAMDERMTNTMQKIGDVFMEVHGIIQENLIDALVNGTKTVQEAFADMAIQVIQMVLKMALSSMIASAADAAVKAGSAVASIPYIGPILAVAAASSVFAALAAYRNKAKSGMAYGGIVTGGVPNEDSVPANLMPGERVLNRREVVEFERMKSGRGSQEKSVIINVGVSQTYGTQASLQNYVNKAVVPSMKRLAAYGVR